MARLSSPSSTTRQLFKLAVPVIGINLLAVLMLAVDSALCGRLPNSEDALAALGFAIQIIFLLMVAMLGLIVGTVALVARAYGGKAMERVNELLAQSTQLTVIVGVFVGAAGAVLAGPLLEVLGATPAVRDVGVQYLRPLMIGTPFMYLGLLYAGVLRGVGNTRIPFVIAIGANVLNALLNYALVLGNLGAPALGVTGSAIGTVIAQAANVVALVYVLRGGRVAGLDLKLRPRPIDRGLARELYRVGWPAALDMLVLNAGFLAALAILGRIDPICVAAHGLGLRVQSLAFVPGLGIAQATGAMIGQALGGGDAERARRVARAAMVLCLGIMTALAVIVTIAAYPLVWIFDVKSGTRLEGLTVEWMYMLAIAMLPAAINIALIGLLQGAGATRISLRINALTTLFVQIPIAYVLAFPVGMAELGVWLSFPIVFAAKAVALYVIYRRGAWAVTGVRVPTAAVAVET
jgi:putative MATE family efflux protein